MTVHPEYCRANVKILIVGQETCKFFDTVGETKEKFNALSDDNFPDTLNRWSSKWLFGTEGHSKKHTAFWSFITEVKDSVNEKTGNYSNIAWSNLLHMDAVTGKKSSKVNRICETAEEMMLKLKLVQKEIVICQPDAIVFLVGPKYVEVLKKTCSVTDGTIQAITKVNPFRMFLHTTEPLINEIPCFYTYHPGYLRRNKALLRQVTSEVRCWLTTIKKT